MRQAPSALKKVIDQVLTSIEMTASPIDSRQRNYSLTDSIVRCMRDVNGLDEDALIHFTQENKSGHLASALALLSGVETVLIAKVLEGIRTDLILIPCRAAALNWNTVSAILSGRPGGQIVTDTVLAIARRDFGKLSMLTAQRTLRFWQLHHKIEK